MIKQSWFRLIALLGRSTLAVGLWKAAAAHWQNALWWSLCNFGGGLAPLWIAIFLRRLFSHPANLRSFVEHGDLALYAAAFLAPLLFQIVARIRRAGSLLQIGALILTSLALVFAALVFTAVSPELANRGIVNEALLLRSSSMVFLFASGMAIAVFLNEAQLENPDLTAAEMVDRTILSDAVQSRSPVVAPGLITPPIQEPDFGADEAELRRRFQGGEEA